MLQKIKFLLAVEQKIGEQKIDVVFAEHQARPIEQQEITGYIAVMVLRLAKLFNECDKHLKRLNHAAAKKLIYPSL